MTTRDRLPVTATVTDFSKILATVTARDRDRDRDNRESRRSRRTLVSTLQKTITDEKNREI